MSEPSSEIMFCYKHPKKETYLRCNQCGRPICSSCAVLTPTGYRCKECVRGQQKKFDTSRWWDYPVAIIVAGVLAYLASLLVELVGWWMLLLAPVAGAVIAEAVRFVVRKRRSQSLPYIAAAATFLGVVLRILIQLSLYLPGGGQFVLQALYTFLWPAIFAVLAAFTVFYRLKGIQL